MFNSRKEMVQLYCEAVLMAQGEAGFMRPDPSHLRALVFQIRNQYNGRGITADEINATMPVVREQLSALEEDYERSVS